MSLLVVFLGMAFFIGDLAWAQQNGCTTCMPVPESWLMPIYIMMRGVLFISLAGCIGKIIYFEDVLDKKAG